MTRNSSDFGVRQPSQSILIQLISSTSSPRNNGQIIYKLEILSLKVQTVASNYNDPIILSVIPSFIYSITRWFTHTLVPYLLLEVPPPPPKQKNWKNHSLCQSLHYCFLPQLTHPKCFQRSPVRYTRKPPSPGPAQPTPQSSATREGQPLWESLEMSFIIS